MTKNTYFQFKQFRIYQDKCAMKVGTDGVLLGAWANIDTNTKNVLDIGTGTGLIALMLAQKSEATIDAIELDATAATQAIENSLLTPWHHRIRIIHADFKIFAQQATSQYDVIISNPPYFQSSLHTPNKQRTLARHNDSLSIDALLTGVLQLLQPEGFFYVILPLKEGQLLEEKANLAGLYCYKKMVVLPNPTAIAKRVLLCFSSKESEILEDNLIIETNTRGIYTAAYKELTKAYYLHF